MAAGQRPGAKVTASVVALVLATAGLSGTQAATSPASPHPSVRQHRPAQDMAVRLKPGGQTDAFEPSVGSTITRGPRALSHAGDARVATRSQSRATLFRTGHQAGEATLGVTGQGAIFFVGGTMDEFPAVAMNVVVSRDRGATWDVTWPTDEDEKSKYAYAIDPYLYVDPRTDRVFVTGLPLGCAPIAFTDDGESWSADNPICGPVDHETLFAGPPVTSKTQGYPNVVYFCANVGTDVPWSNTCSRSLDGGLTFLPTGDAAFPSRFDDPLSCIGAHGHGVAGSDGAIYLPRVWCGGEPYVAISRDEGATWEQVQVAAKHRSVGAAMENGPAPGLPPAPVHDAGVAVDPEGNIYVVWAGRNRRPYLSTSQDGGKSWSEPLAVDPPDVNEAWHPQIDVRRPGEVAISYLGTSNSPGEPFDPSSYGETTWGGFITVSKNALHRRPTFTTARINRPQDPFLQGPCGPGRCQAEWDYQDVVIDRGGTAWAIYVDQCYDATCAHAAGGGAVPFGEAVIGSFRLR